MNKKIFLALALLLPAAAVFAFGSREKAPPPGAASPRPGATPSPGPPPALDGDRSLPAEIAAALARAGIQTLKSRVPIVDFTAPLLGGGSVSLAGLEGKVVFLNFWATWCPPCREEMPSMEKLHARFTGRNFTILAVDLQEDEKTVAEFVKRHRLSFPVALDGSGGIGGTYGVRGIPTTYIVDRRGGIVGAAVGGKDWNSPEVAEAFELLIRHGD